MQELLEKLEFLVNKYRDAGLYTSIDIIKSQSLLEKEKQQIIDAYNKAYENTYNPCDSCGASPKIDENGEQYFNQTFKQ